MDLDKMRAYVKAADELQEATAALHEADRRLQSARRTYEAAAKAVGTAPVEESPLVTRATPVSGVITPEELRQRTMAVNKKLRGESTIAICQAMPGTITEIVERTGVKKTSVSTLLNRLMKDGIVKKAGDAPIPGYESRTTTIYDLAV